ncbi:phosphoheptose isomerase [Campylobacter mucosalis CCUG 21559]|uniref:Phosphoheptose isomerase n=1 Tax=Campylobacter mucosalis CCUG 21559 TaxID=1032067 RepID=A0A6G5QFM5_9BACT|nr:phosphoheptose isomerase [Campylobacter mucosalis CCUG 21559]
MVFRKFPYRNDYGYDIVFSRQTQALARNGDLLVAISTSGNSKNVLNAIEVAKKLGVKTLGLSGKGGGVMNEMCELNLVIPTNDTPRIQEMHILCIHTICQAVDEAMK